MNEHKAAVQRGVWRVCFPAPGELFTLAGPERLESIKDNSLRRPPMATPMSFLSWVLWSWKATLLGQRKIDGLSTHVPICIEKILVNQIMILEETPSG